VPEQTWSSAGFLDATVHGLLGLQIDALDRRLLFAPHLPAQWNDLSIEHLHLSGAAEISLKLHRTATGTTLQIDNRGDAFRCEFTPELPWGAKLRQSTLNGRDAPVELQQHAQEADAHAAFEVPHGESVLHLDFEGGVSVIPDQSVPIIGEASSGIRIVGVHLDGHVLSLDIDAPSTHESRIFLQTAWSVASARGVATNPKSDGEIELICAANDKAREPYHRVHAIVEFKP